MVISAMPVYLEPPHRMARQVSAHDTGVAEEGEESSVFAQIMTSRTTAVASSPQPLQCCLGFLRQARARRAACQHGKHLSRIEIGDRLQDLHAAHGTQS